MAKYQMFGLVRDKDGAPRVDDPASLHPIQIGMMKASERDALGVWSGCWARDAQGYKKVSKMGDGGFIAEDALIAVSEIFDIPADGSGATILTVSPRCDVPKGGRITPDMVHMQEGQT